VLRRVDDGVSTTEDVEFGACVRLPDQLVEFVGNVQGDGGQPAQPGGIDLVIGGEKVCLHSTAADASCQPTRTTSAPPVAKRAPRT
jgi:hypothetical protein